MERAFEARWRAGSGALRVLVVHTDSVFRATAAEVLARSGHTVRAVRHGGTGVGVARSWQPDVVVMGYARLRMDRWTAHRMATQRRGRARIPVVVVGEATEEEREGLRDAGFELVRDLSSARLAAVLEGDAIAS